MVRLSIKTQRTRVRSTGPTCPLQRYWGATRLPLHRRGHLSEPWRAISASLSSGVARPKKEKSEPKGSLFSCPRIAHSERHDRSTHGLLDFLKPAARFEDLAWAGAVGGADNSIALHQVNQVSGAAVANAHATLQQGSGSLAEFQDEANRVLKQLIVRFLISRAV